MCLIIRISFYRFRGGDLNGFKVFSLLLSKLGGAFQGMPRRDFLVSAIVNASNNLNSVNSDKVNDICHQFSDIFSESAQSFSHESSNSNYKKGKKSGLENSVKMPGSSTILQKGNIQNILQLPQK